MGSHFSHADFFARSRARGFGRGFLIGAGDGFFEVELLAIEIIKPDERNRNEIRDVQNQREAERGAVGDAEEHGGLLAGEMKGADVAGRGRKHDANVDDDENDETRANRQLRV